MYKPVKCFWCAKLLQNKNQCTVDHLFSVHIRRNFHKNRMCVKACEKCNSERGHISGVFALIDKIRKGVITDYPHKRVLPCLFGLLKRVNVLHYRSLIEYKITDAITKQVCLMEIDSLLTVAITGQYMSQ